jgi:DNA-binding transcriptional MerR regulator/methylmalonyl-CoA mutase cobalamin-binding subunit
MEESRPAKTSSAQFSIGAVSRATGLSPDILRVWQKRYGFPVPRRKPSGHRLYSASDVRRLRRICEAIARGHRPSQVVALPEPRLEALLLEDDRVAPEDPSRLDPLATLLDHVMSHRRADLTTQLLAEAATLGPIDFLESRIAPLTDAVGDAWASGRMGIHQEHFYSECAEDVLRTVRLPYERNARGPIILLATLPGEEHGLGLQMVALVTAVSGLRPHLLGTNTPVSEIAEAWVTRNAEAIGLSVSPSSGGAGTRRYLAELRDTIPMTVPIFVGGKGARRSYPPRGVAIVEDLRKVFDWMRMLRARAS